MSRADVYKNGVLAATLETTALGTEFRYLGGYVQDGGTAVATTLPLSDRPRITPRGSVPPFFAGLLPEGRRLTALRRAIKASADDELSMLIAVGLDTVGDVQVVEAGRPLISPDEDAELAPTLDQLSFRKFAGRHARVEMIGLAGVQDKVSGRMISLPASFAGRQYILKLTPPEFPHIVENEAFFIDLARECGVPCVDAELVHDRDGAAGLLVTRYDRLASEPSRAAVEDGCQVLDLWPADKYNVTTEAMVDALAARCAAEALARRDAFRQWLFALATGNGDLHAKNMSIVRVDGEWRIAPAYDLPATVFYGDSSLALAANNKRGGFSRNAAIDFAARLGVRRPAAERVLDDVLGGTAGVERRLLDGELPFDESRIAAAVKELGYRRRLLMRNEP